MHSLHIEPVLDKNLHIHIVVQRCSQEGHATGWSLKIREREKQLNIVMREVVCKVHWKGT